MGHDFFSSLHIRHEDDQSFLQALFISHQPSVFRTALRYLHNSEDAADITSETFLSMMGNPSVLRQLKPEEIEPYLRGTARNKALMLLRRRKAQDKAYHRLADGAVPRQDADPEARTISRCLLDDVRQAFVHLSPGEAEALRLQAFDNLSDAEISHILHICNSSVRARLTRGRKHLRQIITGPSDLS